jgi:hypothetical protein
MFTVNKCCSDPGTEQCTIYTCTVSCKIKFRTLYFDPKSGGSGCVTLSCGLTYPELSPSWPGSAGWEWPCPARTLSQPEEQPFKGAASRDFNI